MQRDAVGASEFRRKRRMHRVGRARAPRLPQGRHVIDVESQGYE
jgi:hypothetical protein